MITFTRTKSGDEVKMPGHYKEEVLEFIQHQVMIDTIHLVPALLKDLDYLDSSESDLSMTFTFIRNKEENIEFRNEKLKKLNDKELLKLAKLVMLQKFADFTKEQSAKEEATIPETYA